jgi:hypothetical protein
MGQIVATWALTFTLAFEKLTGNFNCSYLLERDRGNQLI